MLDKVSSGCPCSISINGDGETEFGYFRMCSTGTTHSAFRFLHLEHGLVRSCVVSKGCSYACNSRVLEPVFEATEQLIDVLGKHHI